MTTLFLEGPVLKDEAKYICVPRVNAAAVGDQITVPTHPFKFQSMLNPDHYLSDSRWDFLVDPHVQVASKTHILGCVCVVVVVVVGGV